MSQVRSSLLWIAAIGTGCATARENPNARDAAGGGSDARGIDGSSSAGHDAGTDSGDVTGCAFSGELATWTFTGQAGNQASTAVSSTAHGATASGVQRSAGLTALSGQNSINSSNWPTTATVDTTKYYTVSVTPAPGCMIALTTVAIDAKASGTGPAVGAAATSVDAFAQTTVVSTAAPGTITLNTSATTNAIELRIYGYSATATGGTLRLQTTLAVNGTLQ